jgi:site-specific DNA recombinase
MVKRAIIYTRVSTDEQNNGYSPADQKEKLYRYCENNNIDVVGFYHDDASGKSFERPEWKKIMDFLRKNKNSVDYIYFLKWDRFSRNAPEAYAELGKLKKLNVEARAMEQPLDLEIPEQKVMLAIYLTAPEVDNDRRSLNIFHGIRRGKKEGRWLGACPRGYKNTRDSNNRPIISPEGGEKEKLVKLAFKEFATGLYNIEEIRNKLSKKGLKCNRNSFWMMLRNKVYIGKVFVPAYKGEPAEWVSGKHQAIIDDDTFYKVQDILTGRKRNVPGTFKTLREEFPLRGHLICPQCNNKLTASMSRGKMGTLYAYYHCTKGCPERQKAELINESFVKLLKSIKAKPNSVKLFKAIVKDKFKNNTANLKIEVDTVNREISKQKQRILNARSLMLDGDFTPNEFKEMKIEIEEKITKLTCKLNTLNAGTLNLDVKIEDSVELLLNLDKLYEQKDTATKQRIVSSIFPSKLIFDNKKVRTLKMNKVLQLLCSNDRAFRKSKKRKHTDFGVPSLGVESEGFEPSSKQGTNKVSTCLAFN